MDMAVGSVGVVDWSWNSYVRQSPKHDHGRVCLQRAEVTGLRTGALDGSSTWILSSAGMLLGSGGREHYSEDARALGKGGGNGDIQACITCTDARR